MGSTIALFAGTALIVTIFNVLFFVLRLLTAWKVFEKYGEPGWKGLIPFYNDFVEVGKVWDQTPAIVLVVLEVVNFLFSSKLPGFLAWIVSVALFVLLVISAYKKSKSFGHDIGMTIVLILFPFVGNLLIGFSDDKFNKVQ